MKTQIEQEPVACIYNGNQYMRHEFMDDKIPEGATPLYAAPLDTIRIETEYQAATLRIDNDLMVIAALAAERDALKANIRQMSADLAAIEKMRQEKDARMYAEKSALKDAAKLAMDALERSHADAYLDQPAIAALKAVL